VAAGEQLIHDVRPDESGSTCHHYAHVSVPLLSVID